MQCHFFETLFLFNFRGLWDVRHDVDSLDSRVTLSVCQCATHATAGVARHTASAYILRDITQVRQASQCCPFAPDASRAILASPRHMISARHGMVQLNFMRAQKTS